MINSRRIWGVPLIATWDEEMPTHRIILETSLPDLENHTNQTKATSSSLHSERWEGEIIRWPCSHLRDLRDEIFALDDVRNRLGAETNSSDEHPPLVTSSESTVSMLVFHNLLFPVTKALRAIGVKAVCGDRKILQKARVEECLVHQFPDPDIQKQYAIANSKYRRDNTSLTADQYLMRENFRLAGIHHYVATRKCPDIVMAMEDEWVKKQTSVCPRDVRRHLHVHGEIKHPFHVSHLPVEFGGRQWEDKMRHISGRSKRSV